MKKRVYILGAGLICAAGLLAWQLWPRPAPTETELAIARIEALGGWVEVDENDPARPVVAVSLTGTRARDEDLGSIARWRRLERVYLGGTDITSEGLRHLSDLAALEELYLPSTRIDDSGLEHLRRLARLARLDLSATRITDAGLKHLEGLDRLDALFVTDTKISQQGIQLLRRALPGLHVHTTSF
jgi:hypothetical protein